MTPVATATAAPVIHPADPPPTRASRKEALEAMVTALECAPRTANGLLVRLEDACRRCRQSSDNTAVLDFPTNEMHHRFHLLFPPRSSALPGSARAVVQSYLLVSADGELSLDHVGLTVGDERHCAAALRMVEQAI